MRATLAPNAQLTLDWVLQPGGSVQPGARASFVVLTPVLVTLAQGAFDKCKALLADGTHWPLTKVATSRDWCVLHIEHHAVLPDEELDRRKRWVQGSARAAQWNSAQAPIIFNKIQKSLALRILITEVLYAGDEDGPVRIARRTRCCVACAAMRCRGWNVCSLPFRTEWRSRPVSTSSWPWHKRGRLSPHHATDDSSLSRWFCLT